MSSSQELADAKLIHHDQADGSIEKLLVPIAASLEYHVPLNEVRNRTAGSILHAAQLSVHTESVTRTVTTILVKLVFRVSAFTVLWQLLFREVLHVQVQASE